jgi:hypothetical protein
MPSLALHLRAGAKQSHTAAGQDAFLNCSAGGVQSVFHASLLLFHFALGRTADIDLGNTTGQLGQTLFQLFAVVIAGADFDFAADLVDAGLDLVALAGSLR